MIYRVTFGFAGGSVGWSETHAMVNSATDPGVLIPTLSDLATKRAQMLGAEFVVNAIRISRYATEAGARARGVKLLKQIFAPAETGTGFGAEPASVALIARGDSLAAIGNPTFDANENQTFLGGPVDECVDNAGVIYPGRRGLLSKFNQWTAAMVAANMGWLANETIVNLPIGLIVQNANGTVTFTMSGHLLPTLTVGQKYNVRARQINNGVSPLNGPLVCRCDSDTTLTTESVVAFALAQMGGAMRVYKAIAPFVPYGSLSLNGTAGKHKRGRPFLSVPGRAKRRVRG